MIRPELPESPAEYIVVNHQITCGGRYFERRDWDPNDGDSSKAFTYFNKILNRFI